MSNYTLQQFLRFGAVGVAASAVHIAIALLLIAKAGLDVMVANGLAFCGAVVVSYLGNHAWTFRREGRHVTYFPRFLATSLAGLLVNQAIVFAAVRLCGLHYLAAILIVVAVVSLLTFIASKLWAFASGAAQPQASSSALPPG